MTLQARGTGRADFRQQPPADISFPLVDLSARINGVASIDKNGEVYFRDDFSRDVPSWTTSIPFSGYVAVVDYPTFASNHAILLRSNTTTENLTILRRHLYIPSATENIGAEVVFTHDQVGAASIVDYRFEMNLLFDYQTKRIQTRLQYNDLEGVVLVHRTGNVLIANYSLQSSPTFHRMKMVINPVTEEYLRVYIDDKLFILDGQLVGFVSKGKRVPDINVELSIETRTRGEAAEAVVGEFIMTRNEPNQV